MAIHSMTGFGRGVIVSKHGCNIVVEISSVNRKQFDCSISIPRELMSCESKIQACVSSMINRGYVKGGICIESNRDAADLDMDVAAVASQVKSLRSVAAELGLKDDLTASSLLRLPEFQKLRQFTVDPESLWPDVEKTLLKALKKLKTMRRVEGDALEKDLRKRLSALHRISLQIARVAPDVPRQYKKILEQRLEKLISKNAGVDRDLLAREVAVYADRCDISEELTRLESHFEQADKVLNKGGVCGRTLDFICQEMFREINTTGSKAGNAAISENVIKFKAGLEAVREQVQNIE